MAEYGIAALGPRLKQVRLDHGYKQYVVAQKLNLSKGSLCHFERGQRHPSLETLIKLCNFYDLSPEELLIKETNHS